MSLPTSQSFVIKANTVDVSASIDWTSVDLLMVLTKEVSTLKFNIKLTAGKYNAKVGDQIDLYETDSTVTTSHLFGGTITQIDTILEGITLVLQVTCTDWGYTMNGKLVVKSYKDMNPKDIIADIVSTYCPAGFNATTYVQDPGYNISSIKFNYEQPTKCIQSLATQIGWEWNVDADKNIHFFLAESKVAPFDIDDTSGGLEWPTLDVDVNLQNMKNSVFVIGGVYQRTFTSGTAIDVYKTDGTQLVWNLAYAYTESTIILLLDGVPQTTGLANQVTNEAAFQSIYDKANKSLRLTVQPGAGHTLTIYGVADIPIVAHASDQDAIDTYGEFQDAIFDSQIKTIGEAQMRAQAEILLFGHAVYDVKFYTITPGLRVGQSIKFNSTKFGVSNYPLVIKRIEGRGNTSGELRYQVECIGSDNVTFVDMLSTILQQENASTQVDNTTLEPLYIYTELVSITDAMSASNTTGPYFVGTTAVVNFFTCG